MQIDITIPYRPGKQLGECMNDYMQHVEDWVLFLDHDVFLLNPHWYDMCINIIKEVGYKAGWISCKTNRIGCHWQRQEGIDNNNNDMGYHLHKAKEIYDAFGNELFEPANYGPFSGFFILTHKAAWLDAGKFNKGWLVDNPYSDAIQSAGYKRYIMKGLYCYHLYTFKGQFK